MADEHTDDRFKRLLAQQLEMNPRTWAALEKRGVDTKTLLVIEFSFTAPGRREARHLQEVLRQRTSFSAQVIAEGSLFKRHWRVVGHTKPSTASVEMLNDWVTFMVTLGAKHGGCRFDGWGVKVPDAQPREAPGEQLQQGFAARRRNGDSVNGAPPAGGAGGGEAE
jgi:Regulator of ribonuclease activity B